MNLTCKMCGFAVSLLDYEEPMARQIMERHMENHINRLVYEDPIKNEVKYSIRIRNMALADSLPDNGVLVVMVGPPGCGKSELSKRLNADLWFQVVSTDKIREEILGDEKDQRNGDLIFDTAYQRTKDLLVYTNVVFDATNCKKMTRHRILSETAMSRRYSICSVFNTTLLECLERNSKRERKVPEDVIERMWEDLYKLEPSVSEGFDEVISADKLYDSLSNRLAIFSIRK